MSLQATELDPAGSGVAEILHTVVNSGLSTVRPALWRRSRHGRGAHLDQLCGA